MNRKPYYITTAIAYTSGKPHIGNTYEIILADAIARFKQLEGYDVRLQTGTDEHGQKIEDRAKAAGKTPKQYVDEVAGEIRRIWDLTGMRYDRFIRTTDADHEAAVQKIFTKLYEQGDIYKGSYEGMYCKECEAFYTPSQIVDGKCPECGFPVSPASEEAYFFRMSRYAPRLIQHIYDHPEFIQPVSRRNEMLNNFLLPGLQDLCVSRTSFKWGIQVPFDPKHVIYVWIDALSNYITGLGYDVDHTDGELYRKYWPADVHLIGKDILRFHTIYWPIMLMALGVPLPKQVFGHPWLIQGGEKMSKSKGNVLYADDLADVFGMDAVRYFVLHETPFENDGSITWELIIERYNSDLANTLGNLVQRTLSMSNKYFGGVVEDRGAAADPDGELKAVSYAAVAGARKAMETLHVADAITEIFTLFKRCNKYIDETMPWALAKDPAQQDRLATVLYNLAEGIMTGASLLAPFMPATAERIARQFGTALRDFEGLTGFGCCVASGTKVIEKPEMLFARLDEKAVMEKAAEIMAAQKKAAEEAAARAAAFAAGGEAVKAAEAPAAGRDASTETAACAGAGEPPASGAGAADAACAPVEHKPEITFDDFEKLEFRMGEVIACEEVPKSKKLLCSKVKIGNEVRQIVSGIKPYYAPEEMVGKKVMVLVNLKPAKLAGVLSEGMLLCTEDADGKYVLMTSEKDAPSGAEIA
ncbi:MAG: methionine--tRNA ligase [Lachnospiraceae bacterium]|nr:methionine--tRNA ligase [Lachnospiraceae bacterium]